MNLKTANKAELLAFIADSEKEMTEISQRGADLNSEHVERFDTLESEYKEARERIAAIDKRAAAVTNGFEARSLATEGGAGTYDADQDSTRSKSAPTSLRGRTTLAKGESFRTWAADNGQIADKAEPLSFDRLVRGLASDRWDGAEAERALVTTNSTAIVPTPLATDIIDLARAKAVVLQAGATIVPMTSSTLRIPRLTGEGSPQFYSEGAQRVAQDISFDAVTLTAHTMDRLILISKELFEDSDPAAGTLISDAFAAQYALGLDRFALFGDGVTPNPLGLVNTPGVPKVANGGANGAALSSHDFLIKALGNVAAQNFTPTAQIASPRTATQLALLKNSQGDYITPPANLPPAFVTAGVPVNLTTGTSSDTSVVITGQFDQLYIGLRSEFTLKVLPERWADTGQIGFLASQRWDVAVAQPLAFQVDTGLRA
ncbi:major capsid protein [Rhodococcus sp. 06-156-3C]|uniref:phage major capsid protein n=1 Tax=Nocardiaceae TaxID=85025 RepID=UPI000522EE6F|nr:MULTISPECIES: phage major capsid protein [Rhodococcus]OZD12274.1 major capsid protein [Rhodococcus sp. 06-156-3C]OZD19060.1 major capsid protein [Rhodococcus sp. 06-156-4C]OZD20900.1 major capsid protein [Rhodococcus sp. 06-156-4a]OZD29075.1 major capsid protein [Rhodococcus sp. 06-156-3b]OZD33632.1 major capsid protein [Rhodococcus sp. 06-156-3]